MAANRARVRAAGCNAGGRGLAAQIEKRDRLVDEEPADLVVVPRGAGGVDLQRDEAAAPVRRRRNATDSSMVHARL